jgi:hypothetical protein
MRSCGVLRVPFDRITWRIQVCTPLIALGWKILVKALDRSLPNPSSEHFTMSYNWRFGEKALKRPRL